MEAGVCARETIALCPSIRTIQARRSESRRRDTKTATPRSESSKSARLTARTQTAPAPWASQQDRGPGVTFRLAKDSCLHTFTFIMKVHWIFPSGIVILSVQKICRSH